MPDLYSLFPYSDKGDILQRFRNARSLYTCPKDENGKRLGPLVQLSASNSQRPLVSDLYFNVAVLEERMNWIRDFAFSLARRLAIEDLKERLRCETVVSVPRGGLILGTQMALQLEARYLYLEKNLARNNEYHFSRSVSPQSRPTVCIVEDVVTTGRAVYRAIDALNNYCSPDIVAIVCFINRTASNELYGLPIVSLLEIRNTVFDITDPEVAEDVISGNICNNPREQFSQLLAIMEQYRESR